MRRADLTSGAVAGVESGLSLRARGLQPGPRFAYLLEQLLAARLDGQIDDITGERVLLDELLNETGESKPS